MAMKGAPKINKLIGVYHLQYEMEQKIVEFDIDGTDASKKCDEEYTLEMHHALLKGERIDVEGWGVEPLNWKKCGKIHLGNLAEGGDVAGIEIKAVEKFKREVIETAFYKVHLPDVSVVEQAQPPVGNNATPTIHANKDGGLNRWNWNFRAIDMDHNCLLECSGSVNVICETLPE